MTAAIRIFREPIGIEHNLAATLVDLDIEVRPALLELTNDPTIGADARFIFILNDHILEAIAAGGIGSERAEGFSLLLPLGRATRIPRDCCYEVEI